MYHQLRSFFIFGCAVLVAAYKTDTWPPKEVFSTFNPEAVVATCLNKCPGSTSKEMEVFETTTDLKNLPNSPALKCYIHCCMVEANAIYPNSTRINIQSVMEGMERLPKEAQDIIFRMSRGCMKRTMHIKDPLEYCYVLNVCTKENDPEHYYFIY